MFYGVRFRVLGLGLGFKGLGFRVSGFEFWVLGLWFGFIM